MASSSSGANHKPPPVPPRPVNLPRPSMLQSEGQSESQISSRCRYIVLVYLLVVVILLLALVQWELVCYYKSLTDIFLAKYWISVSCMLISAPLLAIFLLIRQVRYFPILGWLLMCSIITDRVDGNWCLYLGCLLPCAHLSDLLYHNCDFGDRPCADWILYSLRLNC
ncbi:uncharacterized protein Dsimw501_GD13092, isoform B [Drosophila simulans]|uniref:Uncharacterized protein, isoform B n=1 Tax=Drosophila simulans TaxID=7240 RepID=A0A0J9RRT1_DROSI|nr:uncharacterized protein Dsimw501_GD13092, isoform B [Drosophila simulans]